MNGTDVFYILARGHYHVAAAHVLSVLLSEDRIVREDDEYIGEVNIEGKKTKTAVIRMVRNRGFVHEPLDVLNSDEVCQTIGELAEIPEAEEQGVSSTHQSFKECLSSLVFRLKHKFPKKLQSFL